MPQLYGYNQNNKPIPFPVGITGGSGPYVVERDGEKWYALHPEGVRTSLSDTLDYKRFVKKRDWIPFKKNPFKKKA